MVYKPRQQNQAQFGDEIFPDVIQAPLRMRVDVQGFESIEQLVDQVSQQYVFKPPLPKPGDTMLQAFKKGIERTPPPRGGGGGAAADSGLSLQQLAEQAINFYSTNIQHFVDRLRLQRAIGGIEQQRHKLSLPGLDAFYTSNQGAETLQLIVKPVRAGAQPQITETIIQAVEGIVVLGAFQSGPVPPALAANSKDGEKWTDYGPPPAGYVRFMAYANAFGFQFITMLPGLAVFRTADNGLTWQGSTLQSTHLAAGLVPSDADPSNKVLRMILDDSQSNLYYSNNGLSVTGSGFQSFYTNERLFFVNDTFFVCEQHTTIGLSQDPDISNTRIASSKDGKVWVESTLFGDVSGDLYRPDGSGELAQGEFKIASIAWNGKDKYIAFGLRPYWLGTDPWVSTGSGLAISTSSDGVSWGPAKMIFVDQAFISGPPYPFAAQNSSAGGIAFGNNVWVAVGEFRWVTVHVSTQVATSTDGVNWTIQPVLIPNSNAFGTPEPYVEARLNDVVFSQDQFIACGYGLTPASTVEAFIFTSKDGVNWTRQRTDLDTLGNVQWERLFQA